MKPNFPLHPILVVVSLASLVSCANTITTGTDQLNTQIKPTINKMDSVRGGLPVTETTVGTTAYADQLANTAKQPIVAKRATTAWYGQRTIPVLSDGVLPPVFKEKFTLDFDNGNRRVPIALVAERLSRITGVPVRVKQDVYSGKMVSTTPSSSNAPTTATSSAPTTLPTPTGLTTAPTPMPKSSGNSGITSVASVSNSIGSTESITSIDGMSMKWNGSLEGFLDHVTGILNLSWGYRDGVVVIERYVTESFELTAFGGSQKYKMGITGGNSGTGSSSFGNASASMDVSESGESAALNSLKVSIEQMVKTAGGSVNLNEGSGRINVTAPKDVLAQVRELIRQEDSALKRQAQIQLDIYSVINSASDEYGVDWTGFLQDLAKTWSGTINTPSSLVSSSAGGISYTLLKNASTAKPGTPGYNTAERYGGSKAIMQALHKLNDSAQYRPVSLIAMNRQWARKTSLRTTGYVSETTPSTSSTAGSGAPGLKTSSVTTGDKFLVQPAIMDDGTIYLKFGVSLTDLIGLLDVSAGEGASLQRVQTPETSGTDDQGTIKLNPGESMVITGLSRRIATSDRNGLAEEIPIVAGGSKKRLYKREDFLIVVRATPL